MAEFKKWIKFYLHFCHKYQYPPADPKSLPLFIEKLASKHQTLQQQERAHQAVGLQLLPPGGNFHFQHLYLKDPRDPSLQRDLPGFRIDPRFWANDPRAQTLGTLEEAAK